MPLTIAQVYKAIRHGTTAVAIKKLTGIVSPPPASSAILCTTVSHRLPWHSLVSTHADRRAARPPCASQRSSHWLSCSRLRVAENFSRVGTCRASTVPAYTNVRAQHN